MAGKRAAAWLAIIAEYRAMGIKKADAIALFAVSDSVPGFIKTKAKRVLIREARKAGK